MVHSVRKSSMFLSPYVFGLFPKVRRASQRSNAELGSRATKAKPCIPSYCDVCVQVVGVRCGCQVYVVGVNLWVYIAGAKLWVSKIVYIATPILPPTPVYTQRPIFRVVSKLRL